MEERRREEVPVFEPGENADSRTDADDGYINRKSPTA